MTSGIIRRGRVFQTLALALLVFLFQPSESQQIISVRPEWRDDIFDEDFVGSVPIPAPSPTTPPSPANPIELAILDDDEDPPDLPSWCESFSMSEFDRDYKTDGINSHPDMWALHALQWKAYVHETVDGGSFNEGLISQDELNSQAYPLTSEYQSCTVRADFLNDLESRPNVYTSNTGAPVDPNGSWTCVDESDLSSDNPSLEGAIIAALNMHFWKTPTYVDIKDTFFTWYTTKAVIEKVTLCTKHDDPNSPPPPPPTTVCGWNNANWSDLIDISDDCEDNIDLHSVTFSFFTEVKDPDPFRGGYFKQNFYMDHPDSWEWIYGAPSTLIFDPPAGTTKEDIHNLVEAAKKASGSRVRRK
jgi:hypothetical protein